MPDGTVLEKANPCPACQPVAWLRRCHGQPAEGIFTSRAEAELIPRMAGTQQVRGSLTTGLTWLGAGRTFTLEPLTAEQLAAWQAQQGILPARPGSAGAET